MEAEIRLEYPGRGGARRAEKASLAVRETFGPAGADGWMNRLIEGENLAALGALGDDPAVAGKVTLVYIDPPFRSDQEYRAGNGRTATVSASREDATAYEDRLGRAAYLEFLRERLAALRELMAEEGSIYVHIDWKMGHYVKVLLDEVFGAEQFVNDITRVKCNPKNFARRAWGNSKDMILFYSKTGRHVWNETRVAMTEEEIARLFPKVDAQGRRYTTNPLHAPGETRNGATGGEWKGLRPPRGRHWRYDPAELTRLDEQGLIEWSSKGNPRKKIFAEDAVRAGKKRQDIWTFKDPAYPSYPTEKNLQMLELIVRTSSNAGDVVLDCFAGSGGTLVAAETNGRRWVGIDDSPVAVQTARGRLEEMERVSPFAVMGVKPVPARRSPVPEPI